MKILSKFGILIMKPLSGRGLINKGECFMHHGHNRNIASKGLLDTGPEARTAQNHTDSVDIMT